MTETASALPLTGDRLKDEVLLTIEAAEHLADAFPNHTVTLVRPTGDPRLWLDHARGETILLSARAGIGLDGVAEYAVMTGHHADPDELTAATLEGLTIMVALAALRDVLATVARAWTSRS